VEAGSTRRRDRRAARTPGGAVPSVGRIGKRAVPIAIALFAGTLFLGAFLLFVVEPIVAKAVLPTFGGAPMVWNTCVVFFQVVLLAGYGYAHAARRWLESQRHAFVYAILLALPLLTLPFATHIDALPPGKGPTAWLLLQLIGLIGLPFFALSTSAAVLQRWFSTTRGRAARDPYFLYAASNMGSLLALIAYPSVIEPTLRLRDQSRVWTIGYVLFVGAAYACGVFVWRHHASADDALATPAPSTPAVDRAVAVSPLRRARWIALSFIPSSLMLAVTTYFSTDIAAVPLLWVVPLSLYLLTFVIAFGARSGSAGAIADRALPLLVLPLAMLMITQAELPLWFLIPLHLLAFVMAGLVCHAQLAADRPPPSSLTEFYFWIALGGMLGGMFNTLAAPLLFNTVVEYPLVLVLACLARSGAPNESERPRDRWMDVVAPIVVGALTVGMLAAIRPLGENPRIVMAAMGLPAFAAFHRSRSRTTRFALALGAMLLAGSWGRDARTQTLHVERTFFGVYRVSVDAAGSHRLLFHGTTLHGLQAIDPSQRHEPLGYYHRTGPFGQAFPQLRNLTATSEIAVVGLGVGSLASYAGGGQRWTFYELDPAVERLARTEEYFTYLRDCSDRCRVVLGDARVSLADARPRQYDLMVIDAFSSDAIPMHLLTDEAFALYLSRLGAGGVLALHISNRHVSLGPVLARLAHAHQLIAIRQQERLATPSSDGKSESDWVLMAARSEDLGSLPGDARWTIPAIAASTPLWTDDASSILSVLHYR
jgi:hypothetical protein